MSKCILVTGATGNQGGAVIKAMANLPDFTLLAVTRDPSGSSAQKLLSKGSNIKVVQGDMNDVPTMFANAEAAAGGNIWGVFSVQLSQGKGITFEGEIKQGKAMFDEAKKRGVKHFVYTSVERGGDDASWSNKTPIHHFQTKYEIEHYIKENTGSLSWTILRPVAFMDNLSPGFPTQVFVAALRDSVGSKPMQWVAVDDIGRFAKLSFEDPEKFNRRAIGLAGDQLTIEEMADLFKQKTGSALTGTYWFLGSLLKYMVTEVGSMVNWFGSEGYKADIQEIRQLHPGLMSMEDWIVNKSSFPKV